LSLGSADFFPPLSVLVSLLVRGSSFLLLGIFQIAVATIKHERARILANVRIIVSPLAIQLRQRLSAFRKLLHPSLHPRRGELSRDICPSSIRGNRAVWADVSFVTLMSANRNNGHFFGTPREHSLSPLFSRFLSTSIKCCYNCFVNKQRPETDQVSSETLDTWRIGVYSFRSNFSSFFLSNLRICNVVCPRIAA